MPEHALKPWSQAVRLHPDVERGDTAVATYAIDLGALVARDPRVPRVYRQARDFFEATHLTSGLRRLLEDVLGGLGGGTRDRVLQLRSPFGGGKSHTLAALYHGATDRRALDVLPEGRELPDPGPVRVAVFDGEKFDVQGGEVNGQRVHTMWGALAAQLGCYERVAYHDRERISPGGDVIAAMLGDEPALLLLDEVLKYLERVSAQRVGDTTLGRLVQDFLQSLSVEVARTSHAVMVYSLQASTREAFGDEALLTMLDHLTSRVDAKREPVLGDEILAVLRRRLLSGPPDADAARAAAEALAGEVCATRAARAADQAGRYAAEDERLALRDRIEAAYPFHPSLIDVMTERWASLPDFQRTRGALRFLSVCLHTLKREGQARELLGPGDVPLDDQDVQYAFFTEVGQREPFKAVLQRDFAGPNARVRRIDEAMAAEHPSLSGVQPALRIATAILIYSFGGPRREDEAGGDPVATGVAESELLCAVVGPGLDSITAETVLKRLREQCLFLHYDGAFYAFKTTPNVTQVLEDVANNHIRPAMIKDQIEDELKDRLSGRAGALLWPADSLSIPHTEPRFLLAYLPLDFAYLGDAEQRAQALERLAQHGDEPRRYRNGLGLAVPARAQVEELRRATRYLLAVKRVRDQKAQYNLTSSQVQQLDERRKTEQARFESAIRELYPDVWLPTMAGGRMGVEVVSTVGRPLAARGIHERLIELLTEVSRKLFDRVTCDKIVEQMRLGASENAPLAVRVSQVVDAFYSSLGFPRLLSEAAIREGIAQGVHEGVLGYVGRSLQMDADRIADQRSEYRVRLDLVRLGVDLPAAQIDVDSGLIVLPQAVEKEQPKPEIPGGAQPGQTPGIGTVPGEGDTPTSPTPPQPDAPQTAIRLRMRMTRSQLYASWNALANLADQAGSIEVSVSAVKLDGFDPRWLQNAVLEPLDEADVVVEEWAG